MSDRAKTFTLLIGIVVILIVWDVYVYCTPEQGDTISRVVHDLGTRSWAVLISVGALLGHWFWRLEK